MEKLINSYFLYPSKIFVSRIPVNVITILGSCVSVCLWDRKERFGGINHFMLPLWNGKELASPKYGNIAIERLMAKMIEYGANKKNLVAKLFGGSESVEFNKSVFHTGKRNIEIAHELLSDEKIQIVNECTGSAFARRILFRTSTGEVLMKFVNKQEFILM